MKIYDVMQLLYIKNHIKPTINYAVVEYLPKFHMGNLLFYKKTLIYKNKLKPIFIIEF